jgi:hypothetical protein
VLQKLSEQVKACYQRALDANRKAHRTCDAALKADFLEMERHWLVLARSYQFTERLTDFTAANADWRRRFDERCEPAKDQMTNGDCKRSFSRETSMPCLRGCGWLPSSSTAMTL